VHNWDLSSGTSFGTVSFGAYLISMFMLFISVFLFFRFPVFGQVQDDKICRLETVKSVSELRRKFSNTEVFLALFDRHDSWVGT